MFVLAYLMVSQFPPPSHALSGAPLPWQGLKIARHLPPVCPQKPPDVSSQSSANISRARYRHLLRLLPYLKSESEDCLYLNLYVPHAGELIVGLIFIYLTIVTLFPLVDSLNAVKSYAVLVYLHGESFEWNSGNAYDGSVLASYGEVIVVTVNYRLGVLGKCGVIRVIVYLSLSLSNCCCCCCPQVLCDPASMRTILPTMRCWIRLLHCTGSRRTLAPLGATISVSP